MGSWVRRRLHSRLLKVAFVLGSVAAAGVVAGVVSGADQPSIASDLSSYASGDTVVLSGEGWQVDETVELVVDDDQDDSWTYEADVAPAVDGTLSHSFDLPELEGEFSVSANALSGTASASFTVAAPEEPAEPTAPAADPKLASDEETYTPGDAVRLSGSDWRAGDAVQITVDDDANDAWDHSADATVAADGSFEQSFDLPSGLAASFTATATDPTDRSASVEFSASFTAATEAYLVRFASGTSAETQSQILAAAGAEDVSFIAPLRIHGVLLPGGAGLEVALDRLRSNPSVTRVEPDRTREAGGTPSDASYGDQWALPKIGWNNVFGELSPSGSARVAILDTGVDGSHPDLDGNVVPGTSILDGSNGLSDPNGHGTAMAGIVAAETNNGSGVAGVGFAGVEVMPVTVLDSDGTGQDSDIIEGVVYAAENDADVILMAFSNPGYSELLQAAIDYAWEEGAVLVAATGNDGSSAPQFPAGDRGVIGVSNTDEDDALNGSSNFGQAVFLGAPGTSIATTSAGGGTATISGTSAAAAHVAGAAALVKAASGASNGVIVSRLARNAEPAGSRDQTGNGRLSLDRAIADTSTDSIQPAGADPLGGGGPIVGPYVAAAPSPDFDIAPSHVPAIGSHVFTALVRNTIAPAANDTARCVRITPPAGVTFTAASFVVASPGTGAGETGNWTLTSAAGFVQVHNNESGSGGRGLAGTAATSANWVRFEITATAASVATGTWTARMHQTGTSDCTGGGSTDQLGVRVGGSFSRDYTADFRDASNNVIAAPTATAGSTQPYRIRITRTAGGDDLSYAFVALPTCLTAITGISTTNSTTGGTPDFVASLVDNTFRFVTGGDKLAATGQWTQVHFTATASCAVAAHVFRTASWKNTSPQTAEGDIFKLQTGTGHPTLTVVSANTPPVSVNDSYSTGEDTPLTVPAPGVLVNDTDAQPLTAVLDSAPSNAASFTLNSNGSFSYTPNPNFNGTDSFTYHANDGTADGNIATVTITVTAVNDSPVANNDAATVAEDSGANSIDVLGNDTDADGHTLTVASVTDPANGTAVDNDTNVSYTPDANFCGTDTFDYSVSDGNGGSDTATVTVTVTCANDAPVAGDDVATVAEDSGATTIDVLDNDTDADDTDTLVVASVTDPANGTAVDNDTDVSYTPDANFCGTDTFDYTVSDGNGGSDTATVTVTVTCANDAPNAVNDTATVGEDSGANAIDVLDNDTDADNDTLVVDSVTDPANGTAVDNNTDVSYTPDANFCGTDTFDYTVSDGNGGTDTATVTVTVTCVNDAPLAVDDAYAATEDTLLTVAAPGVLGNDTDPDDASLTAELVDDVSHGTLVLAADGSFTYDPDANYCGPDSFTYRADDGEDESNVATVAITVACVNDAPNAVDDAATVQEDSGATTIDVLDNDTDADATDTLVVASVTDPANGTAVDNDTDVSYTPDANFCGTDTFDYTVSDGNGGTDTATVTVTVTCVNDAPVAVDDLATVAEDASATAIDVLENDTDADPTDTLVVDSVTDPANGTAVDNDTDVSYTPDANFCGTDTFDYTVSDGNGGTDTATVTATVTCVNDAPVAADDSYNATEDTLLTVAAPGVLGNDTDIDDTLLTAVLVDDVSDGTLVLAADGSFTYDPDLNFCGSDSFTYRANDGEDNSNLATVSIAVACVNDAPVANDDSYNATEDTQLTVAAPGVLGNDTDVENSALTAALVGDVSDGALVLAADGSFTYDPDLNFCGSDSFTYRANDGTADSNLATVSITIACVNDAPVANDDVATVAEDSGATSIDVLANDDDAENDTLAVASVTQPAHGSVVDNGTNVTYTPNDDYCGPDSFTYKASDGTDDSNVATVSITVTCVNDAPVASDDSYAATEDTALSVNNAAGVLANDTDVDVGETLTAILVGGPAQAASFTLNANGSFSYTPVLNYCGPDSFTYKANDGEANSNVATASIAVECVNDAPVADDDAATVAEDAGTTAIDVLANDSDVDGDPLTIGSASDPDHGTVVVTGGGAGLTYEPADDYCGTDSFTYTASDGNGGSDTATVSITVTCVNDVPVAEAGGPYTGNEGATVTLDGSSSDDVEGPLTYASTVTPQTGGADDPGAGASCSFVAGTTATSEKPKVSCTDDGIYDVGLTVTDNEGATDGDSTTLTLENVAPTVAQPTFGSALIGCQTAVTLSNISFTDPGTIDRPWTIDIDWGDGSSHDNYQTMTQGSQAPRTHVYATAGTFTATVSVTDKDVDESSNTGSASSSNTTQVYPYSVQFRPPVDGSNATTVVDNKMKNGRTVPVKVTIRDLCSGADLTSSSAPVTIKVTKASGTSGVGDPVEEYADAGNANDGTNEFRWSGEHWIYNLDSKSLGLVVGNRYRVDVYVGSARATVTTWAIIAPVK